jgi:hypothetical protein
MMRAGMTCLPFRRVSMLAVCLLAVWGGAAPESAAADGRMWPQLLADAAKLHLPTKFLAQIPPDFVRFEFEDLHTYAAEYHPGEHRLVLNRTLSFNSAGGTLKPLTKLTHKELEVLYHELFHAYMDYLASSRERQERTTASPGALLSYARKQQACRYGEVKITPVVQRKDETETRYLTDSESWEALNETWAVFIGWAVWHQLEAQRKGGGSMFRQPREAEQWIDRLEEAVQKGEFRGYYVHEDPDERRVAQKRFLAKESQISGEEASILMSQALGFPEKFLERVKARPRLLSFFRMEMTCAETQER